MDRIPDECPKCFSKMIIEKETNDKEKRLYYCITCRTKFYVGEEIKKEEENASRDMQ